MHVISSISPLRGLALFICVLSKLIVKLHVYILYIIYAQHGQNEYVAEDERDPYRKPTKANIRESLNWLVRGCQPGDSLFFYYSGHASQVLDRDGDEMDGFDESLCPMDYETEGRILDDEINEKIVRPLPRGVTLHAVMDTCFSGTFLDLPFMCRMNRLDIISSNQKL